MGVDSNISGSFLKQVKGPFPEPEDSFQQAGIKVNVGKTAIINHCPVEGCPSSRWIDKTLKEEGIPKEGCSAWLTP